MLRARSAARCGLKTTDAGDGQSQWTAYGVPDGEFGLPNRLSEPVFTADGIIDDDACFGALRIVFRRNQNRCGRDARRNEVAFGDFSG